MTRIKRILQQISAKWSVSVGQILHTHVGQMKSDSVASLPEVADIQMQRGENCQTTQLCI